MILLDLFAGRLGWSREFAKRGWNCICVDMFNPSNIPAGCELWLANVMALRAENGVVFYGNTKCHPDAIVASPPCEEFSVHGMKHFHPHPKYPANGIRLFEHTRALCEAVGVPYVMENVRAAQQFMGYAVHHCGPFYLWGNAVPPLLSQGIKKGIRLGNGYSGKNYPKLSKEQKKNMRKGDPMLWASSKSRERKEATAKAATIPAELSSCVAEYFEMLLEKRISQ